MVAIVATKVGRSKRYKCTCGHSEDLKDDQPVHANPDEVLNLDGFQEIP
jgi:hypothetical protein